MNNILRLDETISSCPVCGCDDFYYVCKPEVYKCKKCSSHFRNPRPSENEIIKCYDKGVAFYKWQNQLDARKILWKKRANLIRRYKSKGSLLDIGTGDGFFIQFAKESYDVDATEISRTGVNYAKSNGHSVHHGTIFDKEFDDLSYDVITMWHVLEHFSEPGKVLKRVRSLLKDDGVLFIAVPNEFKSLYSPLTISGVKPAFSEHKCDENIHLTHFTPISLSRTLGKIFGFKVVSLLTDDVHLYNRFFNLPFLYINSIAAKLFGFHLNIAMVIVCRKRL